MCAGLIARRAEKQRMRTNKMLASVVAVFVITWTPFHVHSVIAEFRQSIYTTPDIMVDLALAEFRHDLMLGRFFKLGDVLCRVLAVAHFT